MYVRNTGAFDVVWWFVKLLEVDDIEADFVVQIHP